MKFYLKKVLLSRVTLHIALVIDESVSINIA